MEGLIVDTDTFVIVGAWNREILSQEWVMQNLRRRWKRRFVVTILFSAMTILSAVFQPIK